MIEFTFAGQTYRTARVIGDHANNQGPTMVCVGGIHGNEASGVVALQCVFTKLKESNIALTGRLLGLAGNLRALSVSSRFIDRDLNRIWDRDFVHRLNNGAADPSAPVVEFEEQAELFDIIEPVLYQHGYMEGSSRDDKHSPAYFIDLHTTSATSEPFMAINDQLGNRNFALQFPALTVLGIEEFLRGPLLSYLNDYGPVALAFEAGQHDDPESARIHEAFIWFALINAKMISANQVPDWETHRALLHEAVLSQHGIYEVLFRKPIQADDGFEMQPGFENFSPVSKGELLAVDVQGDIRSPRSARIFMPLYQNSGEDGFFLVRRVPRWALGLSSFLRRFNFERVLLVLPGVSRSKQQPDALVVDQRVAKFLAIQLFHLLGYRRKQKQGKKLIFTRREIVR